MVCFTLMKIYVMCYYALVLNEPSYRMGVSFDPSTIFECLYSHGWVIPSQQHVSESFHLLEICTSLI